jgi:G3E family GTPase
LHYRATRRDGHRLETRMNDHHRVDRAVKICPQAECCRSENLPLWVSRRPRVSGRPRPATDRFETLSWTSEQPVSLSRLQQAINRVAPKLARAKRLFDTVEQPDRLMVFQFAGG